MPILSSVLVLIGFSDRVWRDIPEVDPDTLGRKTLYELASLKYCYTTQSWDINECWSANRYQQSMQDMLKCAILHTLSRKCMPESADSISAALKSPQAGVGQHLSQLCEYVKTNWVRCSFIFIPAQPNVIDTSIPLPEETPEELAMVVSPSGRKPPPPAASSGDNVTLVSIDGSSHRIEDWKLVL